MILHSVHYIRKRFQTIEKVLCITAEEYRDILSIVHYYSFQIDKKNSTEKRNITAPDRRIKEIQTRILTLLQNIEADMVNFWRKRKMLYR